MLTHQYVSMKGTRRGILVSIAEECPFADGLLELRAAIASIPPERRKIITTHDAFGYFGAAYGVEFIAPVGVSTESEASAQDVARIIRQILDMGMPADALVNVNFPSFLASEDGGVTVTVQGRRDANLAGVEERFDGRKNPYYWIQYAHTRSSPVEGTDLQAIASGRISVTPLRLDLTDEATLKRFRQSMS